MFQPKLFVVPSSINRILKHIKDTPESQINLNYYLISEGVCANKRRKILEYFKDYDEPIDYTYLKSILMETGEAS